MDHKRATAIVSNFVSKGHTDALSSLIRDLDLSVLGIEYIAPKTNPINRKPIRHTRQSWTIRK